MVLALQEVNLERTRTPVVVGGVVAIAAVLLSSIGTKAPSSKQSSQNTVRPATASEQASGSKAESATSEALSRDDRGPWYALCQEFAGDRDASEGLSSTEEVEEVERMVKDDKGEQKYTVRKHVADDLTSCTGNFSDFKFLIATVPDPIASHLNIEFDRALESLQRAAALEGYSFERYWLPWHPGHAAGLVETGSSTMLRAEERLRQEQPGLLILRRQPAGQVEKPEQITAQLAVKSKKESPDQMAEQPRQQEQPANQERRLLIFVVAETPTAGLNRMAFLKSLHYVKQLTPRQTKLEISIAGPLFSATLPPLGEAIVDYSEQFTPEERPVFHVLNYGARTDGLIEDFHRRLRSINHLSTFSSLDLKISRAKDDMIRYLGELGYARSEIAVLAEDGTAYGDALLSSAAEADILTLHFPRDLSTIRNAKEIESSTAESQQIAGVNIPSIGVALSLRQDDTNEHDTPPDFAQTQSTARIDRALQAMLKRLRTKRIQAVIVTATNPLDRVFLLEYLHLTVPDVRLATVGADDFMLARPRYIDLSGTLAVTSLPLLNESGVTVSGKPPNVINFPSNASEGIFLASANLLSGGPWVDDNDAKISDCDDISIVGKAGFRATTKSVANQGLAQVYPCVQKVVVEEGGEKKTTSAYSVTIGRPPGRSYIPFIWIMALTTLLAVTLVHIALVCSSNGWLRLGFLPTVSYFSVSPCGVRQPQMFFLFTATCQILLWEWIAVTTTFALYTPGLVAKLQLGEGYQEMLLGLHVGLLTCSFLLCSWLLFKLATYGDRVHNRSGRASIIVALLFPVSTAFSWWRILCHGEGFLLHRPVAVRAVYFLEGLSPVVPVFFVLLAYYLWSLNNLHRLSMVVTRVSLSIPKDNASARELADIVTKVQESIRQSIYIKPSFFVVMGLTIIACCLVRLTSALRGFEVWWFRGWLVTWGFGLLLLIIVAMLYRSWDVWSGLRKILHFLDAALLGKAFSKIPKELSSMRIWSFSGARASLMVQIRTAKLLQRMEKEYPQATTQTATAGAVAPACPLASISSGSQNVSGASVFDYLRQMRCILDAGGIVDRSLAARVSAQLNDRMAQTGFLFDLDASAATAVSPGERNLLELYVAYRFVAFFRYVMRQLRNMLTFVIYGFACLVVGIAAYPFQGRESLGTLMSLVFVLLLGGVAAMMVQMYRDPILKRLEKPSSGLSGTFDIATKVIGVAGVPLVAVLASQFPSVAEVLLNWVRPLVEASH